MLRMKAAKRLDQVRLGEAGSYTGVLIFLLPQQVMGHQSPLTPAITKWCARKHHLRSQLGPYQRRRAREASMIKELQSVGGDG
jgi:hypothetical protein